MKPREKCAPELLCCTDTTVNLSLFWSGFSASPVTWSLRCLLHISQFFYFSFHFLLRHLLTKLARPTTPSSYSHLTKASDIVNPVAMWMAERYCHRKKFVRGSTFSMMGWQGRSSAECTHQLPWVSLRNGTSCLPQIPPGRFPLCR